MLRGFSYLVLLLTPVATGQSGDASDEVRRIGPGVTPPKLLRKVEPQYSNQARDAGIQGTVLLNIIIDAQGRPAEITVISPLGFGLDEEAVAAISRWRFKPGNKDGKPTKILATVEVNFRLLGRDFDAVLERRRTKYNAALRGIRQDSPQQQQESLKKVLELVQDEYPPAMNLLAEVLAVGRLLPMDQERARDLIERAAMKNYGPAIYLVGRRHFDGNPGEHDLDMGREMIERAANLGSVQAQYFLGSIYGAPKPDFGYTQDLTRSEHYFRLCAATGLAQCQMRLGRSLLLRDEEQAMAWLELAADQGEGVSVELVREQRDKLSPEQRLRVDSLKRQLLRRQ